MKSFLCRAFGLYPGEDKNVWRFVLLALLAAFGSSIAEILSISLFVEKVGPASLPFAFMITACILIGASALFLYFLRRTAPSRILSKVLSIAAAAYPIFALILISCSPGNWFWYLLQIVTYSFVAALIASYWTFLDEYHDLQDAKRVYGIYNASFFVGYILSGSLINLTFDKIGPIPLFMLVGLLMVPAIYQIGSINRRIRPVEDDATEGLLVGGKKGVLHLLRLFVSSPYTIFLVSTSLLVQLMRTTTEVSCMETFG
ncbi:MAG: hypothetical protein WC371_05475, partial [Parachlamydiales bacterium]